MYKGGLWRLSLAISLTTVGCQNSTPASFYTTPKQKPLTLRIEMEALESNNTSTCSAFTLLKSNYYLAFRLNTSKQSTHLSYYIDLDNNSSTGYIQKRVPQSGIDFMLEDGVLFQYIGENGTNQWSWKFISKVNAEDEIIEQIGNTIYVKYPNFIGKEPSVYAIGFDDTWEIAYFYGHCATSIEDHGKDYLKEDYQKFYNLNSNQYDILQTKNYLAFTLKVEQTEPHLVYYLDLDHNNTTGYFNKSYARSGAEYKLVDGVLFQYTGENGRNQDKWQMVAKIDDEIIEEVGETLYVTYPKLLEHTPFIYAVALNEKWEITHFYGYFDLKNPIKETLLSTNSYGTWTIAEDQESFYFHFIFNDETLLAPPLESTFKYYFQSNALSYHTKGDLLFQQDALFSKKLLYTIRQSDTLTIIDKRKFPDIQEVHPTAFEIEDANGEILVQNRIYPASQIEHMQQKN